MVEEFVQGGGIRAVVLRSLRGPTVNIEVNAKRAFPGASLLKLPLAIAVYEQVDIQQRVRRAELGRTAYPSILEVFDEDHEFTVGELCRLMLATSDNPIPVHLMKLVGMDAVTATARRLGAVDTVMRVGFSDPELGAAGRASTTTAADIAAILRYLATAAHLRPLITALRNSMRNFRIPLRLPDELPVAHKTGSLLGVVHDAGILYGRDIDLIAVFLTDGESDSAATSTHIGDCMAEIWSLLGEPV